jgi:hypothetical protein
MLVAYGDPVLFYLLFFEALGSAVVFCPEIMFFVKLPQKKLPKLNLGLFFVRTNEQKGKFTFLLPALRRQIFGA